MAGFYQSTSLERGSVRCTMSIADTANHTALLASRMKSLSAFDIYIGSNINRIIDTIKFYWNHANINEIALIPPNCVAFIINPCPGATEISVVKSL